MIGRALGPYQVLSKLGEGGMGEVYRATDIHLKRAVAIKVLPEAVAADADRLSRFQREAEVLAALSHPNIAAIYGLEKTPDLTALVMELVEGEDLSQVVARGPIAVADALPIARQIADALEAAHEQGIVHRDLKPANIKVREDGTVKVLDFGLAKTLAPKSAGATADAMNSPTMTSPALTQMGVILGTAAYMSPEQAAGRPVDRRSDIWAFGVVLLEMLTGRRLFDPSRASGSPRASSRGDGESVAEVVAAVLRDAIDLSALPEATPPRIRRLIARCLDRNPKTRLQHIGEARIALAEAATDDAVPPAAAAPAPAAPRRAWLAPALAVALVGSLAAVAGLLWRGGGAPGVSSTHVSLTFLDDPQPQKGRPIPSLAVSPDGRAVVYTARGPEGNQLWLRSLDGFRNEPIPGTAGGRAAVFSPDGRWIAYQTANAIMKISTTFDPPTTVARAEAALIAGLTWTDRDEFVFATVSPEALWRVAATGGTPVKVADGYLGWPSALPGGTAVVATTRNDAAERSDGLTIVRVDLDTGAVSRLLDGGTFGRWVPGGYLAFVRANNLVATTYDPATNAVGEMRVPVAEDLFQDPAASSGCFAVSPAGTLVFCPGNGIDFERTIVAIDPARPAAPPVSVVDAARYYDPQFAVSPDARRLAAVEHGLRDRIVVIDLERRTSFYLTPGPTGVSQREPVWSPDSRAIAYQAGISILQAEVRDGGGPSETLIEDVGRPIFLNGWTPDGRSLIATAWGNGGRQLGVVRLTPGASPLVETLVENAGAGTYSPDGRWLAVVSARSGRQEVYVTRASAPGGLVRASLEGGSAPTWGAHGDRLYFVEGSAMLAPTGGGGPTDRRILSVTIGSGADPAPGRPTAVAVVPRVEPVTSFAVLPGGRLLALKGSRMADAPELRVVLNWFDELRRKVSGR